ncbi:hypothetical protein CEXT_231221 [Caerostris extrusa]|uniref:Uncharacterized protein n=1 Tax=Caerostris extrusa TaxID=172846 RepID=A0AAV4RFG5_CAEEX|nr:hypothetical protein CEXT_231221 [Caerostris extrusa]
MGALPRFSIEAEYYSRNLPSLFDFPNTPQQIQRWGSSIPRIELCGHGKPRSWVSPSRFYQNRLMLIESEESCIRWVGKKGIFEGSEREGIN